MINNNSVGRWGAICVVLTVLGSSGCRSVEAAQASPAPPLQGVVELEEVPIGFELGGRLTQLLVREGDTVEVGALLARLDDGLEKSARDAQAGQLEIAKQQAAAIKAGARGEELRSLQSRIDAARATEDVLQKQVQRQRELVAKGAIAPATLDDMDGQLARASAERASLEHSLNLMRQGARREDVSVATARAEAASAALEVNDARLSRHELLSPVKGTVLDVNFKQGEVIGPASPVFTLADTKHPYIEVFVPQAEISAVSLGQSAHVKIDALRAELTGHVEHIARRTEFTPRYLFSEKERSTLVVRVKIRVDDPDEKLRAGVPAFVHLEPGAAR